MISDSILISDSIMLCNELMFIPEPAITNEDSRNILHRQLLKHGYNEAECAHRFGVTSMGQANFGNPPWRANPNDFSDDLVTLLRFFLFGRSFEEAHLYKILTHEGVSALKLMGLAKQENNLVTPLMHLFPCEDLFIVTDLKRINEDINRVMFLWPDSISLAQAVFRKPLDSMLDLGTGSGVHALLAARHCKEVVGVDNSSRSIAFSNFNKWFNKIDNAFFLLGDLYEPVSGKKFDWILANPPYIPSGEIEGGANYSSGGTSGEEILRRVIGGLDCFLTERGLAQIITLLAYQKGVEYKDKMNGWMSGHLDCFDILIYTKEDRQFQAGLSESHAKIFSKFEYGLMNIRRSKKAGDGFYLVEERSPFSFFKGTENYASVGHPTLDLKFKN